MHEVIFVKHKDTKQTLDAAAKDIFELLNIRITEERESSNYIDGRYFVGYGENLSLKVCFSDGATKPEYPFWVVIKSPPLRKGLTHPNGDPSEIARILAKGGWEVFVPIGSWSQIDWDERGTVYGA